MSALICRDEQYPIAHSIKSACHENAVRSRFSLLHRRFFELAVAQDVARFVTPVYSRGTQLSAARDPVMKS